MEPTNIKKNIYIVSFKAAGYGLDGPENESRKGRDLPHPFNRPLDTPSLL
jgi:hypothetical protein